MKSLRKLVVGILILASAGCATAPGAPPAVDVSGTWEGQWRFHPPTMGGGTVSITVKQTGAQVTGDARVVGPALDRPTTVAGTVIGSDFRLTGPHVTGWLTVKGDQMSGVVDGILPAQVELTRRR